MLNISACPDFEKVTPSLAALLTMPNRFLSTMSPGVAPSWIGAPRTGDDLGQWHEELSDDQRPEPDQRLHLFRGSMAK